MMLLKSSTGCLTDVLATLVDADALGDAGLLCLGSAAGGY